MENTNENPKKSDAALKEEAVLKFWTENKIFEKSLAKESPRGEFVFYDGPPFATGQMHYGHILGSTAKDVIGRYQTMRGFHVTRRWGWDCHGLPIENIVEKELGIAGHKEIENYGIEKFVEYARSKVLEYDKDWERGVPRIGRWVDFKGGYKTMDNTFIESVWWALSELNKKELIYEGVRVLAYCPRCETPIANSEIAMDNSYKDITDISVYVKFELVEEPNTFLLAWTTTPWTLPGNFALAANPTFNYVKIKIKESFYVLAKERLEAIKEEYEIIEENLNIIGKSYKPLFDYFVNHDIPNKENAWKVYAAEYVTADAGTGIVHTAPGYGEEDMGLAKRENIPFVHHVLNDGTFAEAVRDFMGLPVKPKSSEKDGHQVTDIEIIKHLAHQGFLFAKEKIVHAYPHCMRCDTPIIYYALPSWFVNIQKVKKDILKQAETMSWIPEHLKEGRFKNNLESAPDWTISRNRYWASPLPIWKSDSGKIMFVSGLEDLRSKTKKSGNKYFLMRHGEGTHNTSKIASTGLDSTATLTDGGRVKAKKTAEELKGKNIKAIYCSPLLRNKQTAEIVADTVGFPKENIIFDKRIKEIDAGVFDGKPFSFTDYFRGLTDYQTPIEGGESPATVKRRVGEFLYEIDSKHKDENILIISHGIFFETIDAVLDGLGDLKALEKLKEMLGVYEPGMYREFEFVPIPHNQNYELDLHRPYVDTIKLIDKEGVEYTRIPEVIDCWFESGSMPFAQDHYPFERPDWKEKNFPADFVAEYIAQTRTWFYYSLVISTILFGHAPFKHVVTTGTLRAEDGQKISKSKKNYPDPWIFIDKYGVDALRIYLMSGPLMKGEDSNFSEKIVSEIASKIIGRLYNVLAFYELYRDQDFENKIVKSKNVLDVWIMSRLSDLISDVTNGMDSYDMSEAIKPFDLFVDDLSTWYLRRSRDRIKEGDNEAKGTMYFVLRELVKVLSPFAPFTAENIWQKLKNSNDEESVHLENWPKGGKADSQVLENMRITREIVTLGLEARQKAGIKVRQPLASLTINQKLDTEYLELIKDELNVKDIAVGGEFKLDTQISEELKREGDFREFLRSVQGLRKDSNLLPNEMVTLIAPASNKELIVGFEEELKKTAGLKEVKFEGEEIKIEK